MTENRSKLPAIFSAVIQPHGDRLRRQCIGIFAGRRRHGDTRCQILARGIGERGGIEILHPHIPRQQQRRRHIADAQPRIIHAHAGLRGPVDQAPHQRRCRDNYRFDIRGGKTVGCTQLRQCVESAVRRTPGGKWFVADTDDLPLAPQQGKGRLRVTIRLHNREITEGTTQEAARPLKAEPRHIRSGDGIARIECHLHGQHCHPLGVRLHGATGLAVCDGHGL